MNKGEEEYKPMNDADQWTAGRSKALWHNVLKFGGIRPLGWRKSRDTNGLHVPAWLRTSLGHGGTNLG